MMRLKFLKGDFSVCKLRDLSRLNLASEFFFLSRTPAEISLVCLSDDVPENAAAVEPGWNAFRFEGRLEFSLVGVLSRVASLLAVRGISIFAISTHDTDYLLIKSDQLEETRRALLEDGYRVE